MSQQPVSLKLPAELYERICRVAQNSDRPIETVLVESLALLFGGVSAVPEVTPAAMASYSDEKLWALVHRRLTWPADARLRELITLGKHARLSADEQAELDALLEVVDHYTLMRSQALPTAHHPIKAAVPSPVDPVGIVYLTRSVHAQADEKVVLSQKCTPFIV